MNDHQSMVKDFMISFGQDCPETFTPEAFPGNLRASLIIEEAREFCDAVQSENWPEVIDAICDLLYVTYGAAVALGIDVEPFFAEVHSSNMSKLDPVTHRPTYREDGKVMKPSTYTPAEIKQLMLSIYGRGFLESDV